jgi:hypothetical protein
MSKNGIFLSVVAVILAAIYAYYFTDWFKKETIQIIPTIRPGRAANIPRDPGSPAVCPVSFSFDGKYKLTSVKVVSAAELATNKYATPLWHLIADSNSIPTKSLIYGQPPRGMKPSVPKARPQALEAGFDYVLIVEAGRIRAQTNFHTRELVQPTE